MLTSIKLNLLWLTISLHKQMPLRCIRQMLMS